MDHAMDDIRIMLTHNRCARAAHHAPTARQPSAHIMSVSVRVSSRDRIALCRPTGRLVFCWARRCEGGPRSPCRRLAGDSRTCPLPSTRWLRAQFVRHGVCARILPWGVASRSVRWLSDHLQDNSLSTRRGTSMEGPSLTCDISVEPYPLDTFEHVPESL